MQQSYGLSCIGNCSFLSLQLLDSFKNILFHVLSILIFRSLYMSCHFKILFMYFWVVTIEIRSNKWPVLLIESPSKLTTVPPTHTWIPIKFSF